MVVAEVAVGHVVPATARWAHGGYELHVHQVPERQLSPVVPAAVIHKLPQQLNRRLGAVLLNLRHVQVVHEDNHLLARGRAERPFLALVQLAVDDVLGHVSRRLSGKVHEGVAVQLAVDAARDVPLDVRGLTGARGSHEEEILTVGHQRVDQEGVPDGVHRRDDDRRIRLILADGHVLLEIHPTLPRPRRFIETEVVDRLGRLLRARGERLALDLTLPLEPGGHPHGQLLGDVVEHEPSKVRVKLGSALLVDARADRPNEREEEERIYPDGHERFLHRLDGRGVLELVEERVKEAHERLSEVDLLHGLRHLANLGRHPEARGNEPVEQRGDLLLVRLGDSRRQRIEPRYHHRSPTQQRRLHVHHAAPRHRRRGRHRQVLNLEDHVHQALHGDDLARVEAQLLVIVQHGVHVLDPDGVHGAVEHDPLTVWAGVPSRVAKGHGEDAVGPLLAHRVLRAVQLAHGDGFGVQAVVLDLLFPVQTLVVQLAERIRENGDARRLHAVRLTHEHQAVTHDDHLVQLDDLLEEGVEGLELSLGAGVAQGVVEVVVVNLRQFYAGE